MYWVAVEDVDTYEVTDFEATSDKEVRFLMDGYNVDLCNPERFRVRDTEDGERIVYDGVIYRGGFGYNVWIARKYREV